MMMHQGDFKYAVVVVAYVNEFVDGSEATCVNTVNTLLNDQTAQELDPL